MRRRRVFRTAALYVVAIWLVMQVADVVFPAMDIPERAIRYVLIGGILGFPAAIVFGWIYDIGAHGIRRTLPAGENDSSESRPLSRSDYAILTIFGVVAVAILYNAFSNVVDTPNSSPDTRRDGPPMVAVLPFESWNTTGESQSFAYGVHDDLLTQLSKLQSLRVISRTSVMEYQDTIRNIREIGAALGADAILEGGVQSAGDRIRINAQLIDARTDEHLWAETYDRELTLANIFEVQSEIARAIAAAMRATLTVRDTSVLATIPTENMAAYRAYHRGIKLRDENRSLAGDVAVEYEKAVALDPGFTRAWAELVGSLAADNFNGDKPEQTERAEQALEAIRAIAPESADYLIAKTYYTYYILRDYDLAIELVTQARELMPSDLRLAEVSAWIQRRQGNYEGWLESLRQTQRLNPREVRSMIALVKGLVLSHRIDEIVTLTEDSGLDDYFIALWAELAKVRKHRNFVRLGQAITDLQKKFDVTDDPYGLWWANALNRDLQAAKGLLESMPGSPSDPGPQFAYLTKMEHQIMTHWMLGEAEELSSTLEKFQERIEKDRGPDGEFVKDGRILDSAFIAAAQGNTGAAEALIRRWYRVIADDLAGLMVKRNRSCEILGMAGATTAAVECIRAALVEPSYLTWFVDLYSPLYDPIRAEPKFIELMAEIEDKY